MLVSVLMSRIHLGRIAVPSRCAGVSEHIPAGLAHPCVSKTLHRAPAAPVCLRVRVYTVCVCVVVSCAYVRACMRACEHGRTAAHLASAARAAASYGGNAAVRLLDASFESNFACSCFVGKGLESCGSWVGPRVSCGGEKAKKLLAASGGTRCVKQRNSGRLRERAKGRPVGPAGGLVDRRLSWGFWVKCRRQGA